MSLTRLLCAPAVLVHTTYTNIGRGLGAFANLRKATISFAVSISPPVCPYATPRLSLDGFPRNLIRVFRKSVENIQIRLNLARITGTLHEDLYTFMIVRR